MAFRAALLFLIVCPSAAVFLREASNHTEKMNFVVTDIIKVNGQEVAAGSTISLGCQTAPSDATSFTVCGCNVKVTAHLLTECNDYGKYSTPVGSCDCGSSGCVTEDLTSGYTESFSWKAASYTVEAC
mmetsp:Transcript_108377/g.197248  ORF Transcript_108377/g.197248 Transcript_108377/m.197248 type:complete len:128 (+) Transcript_108377:58-441(+)